MGVPIVRAPTPPLPEVQNPSVLTRERQPQQTLCIMYTTNLWNTLSGSGSASAYLGWWFFFKLVISNIWKSKVKPGAGILGLLWNENRLDHEVSNPTEKFPQQLQPNALGDAWMGHEVANTPQVSPLSLVSPLPASLFRVPVWSCKKLLGVSSGRVCSLGSGSFSIIWQRGTLYL